MRKVGCKSPWVPMVICGISRPFQGIPEGLQGKTRERGGHSNWSPFHRAQPQKNGVYTISSECFPGFLGMREVTQVSGIRVLQPGCHMDVGHHRAGSCIFKVTYGGYPHPGRSHLKSRQIGRTFSLFSPCNHLNPGVPDQSRLSRFPLVAALSGQEGVTHV